MGGSALLCEASVVLGQVAVALVTSELYGVLDLFPLSVELREVLEVVDEQVTELDSLSGLLESVLVAVHLRENGAVLHLELAQDLQLLHAVGDALLLQVELVHW